MNVFKWKFIEDFTAFIILLWLTVKAVKKSASQTLSHKKTTGTWKCLVKSQILKIVQIFFCQKNVWNFSEFYIYCLIILITFTNVYFNGISTSVIKRVSWEAFWRAHTWVIMLYVTDTLKPIFFKVHLCFRKLSKKWIANVY